MASSLAAPSGTSEHVVVGTHHACAAVGPAKSIHHYSEPGASAFLLGEPYFVDSRSSVPDQSDVAKHLVEGFRNHGPAILKSLHGRFSAVVVLEAEHQALLAVDRVAVHPLGFCALPGGIVFGSNADTINSHSAVVREIDLQQIFNYLYFHIVPSPFSIYKTHVRLEPGSYVWLHDGELKHDNYWQLSFAREHERLPVEDLASEFRGLLRDAIARQLGNGRVGAFLSGGTDSSTIAGMLCKVSGQPASTYSIGFAAEGYDEMAYARIAANYFGTRHHEYYVTPEDVTNAIPRIAQVHSEPFGNSSAVPSYFCAQLAHDDGIDRLLAGDGGDELFAGNSRYATQYLLSLYERLPRWLRRTIVEPVTFGLPAGDHFKPVRKLRSYIQQASLPMPARLESWNLLTRLGVTHVLHRDFLAQVDPAAPLRHLSDVYRSARAETLLNRMLALDHKLTLADNDLPKVGRSAELAGIDVAYPLLSDELVAFAARLPVRLKLKGTSLRYFFKDALREFLPPEILTKPKHGFGLPFGEWLLKDRALQELSFDSLAKLKERHIVRADFIDSLIDRDLASHPGYYGPLVWILVMLEQWFQHHTGMIRNQSGPSP